MSEERVKELISSDSPSQNVVRDFGPYEDKPLHLLNGKYGMYIKWGERNCPIPKDERESAMEMSAERARELAAAAPEKKTARVRKYSAKKG